MNQFRLVEISGGPFERGKQHGKLLSTEIAETIAFYRSIFGLSETEISQHAAFYRTIIDDFDPVYGEEIDGIALGASVDPLWIVALNARTEILSRHPGASNECTSVYFSETSILGQNWDWGKALESLTVLMRIVQPDGHTILMMTEPGIIGKIGMNSCGLGVCLNILTLDRVLNGLPVHIILRAILNCKSLAQVNSLLARHDDGKASNIMVADASGNGFDMEFCAETSYLFEPTSNYLLHTNHYLGKGINSEQDPDFASSYARFAKATQILSDSKERSVTTMCGLLSDESDSCLSIYREYLPDNSVHELGTICTIVMELAKQNMYIRKGKGPGAEFVEYSVKQPGIV